MNVAELRLQKEEKKKLSIMLKDQKHEIEECEALMCEVCESVVKTHVLDVRKSMMPEKPKRLSKWNWKSFLMKRTF